MTTSKKETIENIAKTLLRYKIGFSYEEGFLTVRHSGFDIFHTASYHTETKKLVLMDGEYNEVPVGSFYVRVTDYSLLNPQI